MAITLQEWRRREIGRKFPVQGGKFRHCVPVERDVKERVTPYGTVPYGPPEKDKK